MNNPIRLRDHMCRLTQSRPHKGMQESYYRRYTQKDNTDHTLPLRGELRSCNKHQYKSRSSLERKSPFRPRAAIHPRSGTIPN